MPLTPEYQSATDRALEGRANPTSPGVWLATFAFIASVGALLMALITTGGILPDEKPMLIGLLVIASVLIVASFVVNIRSRAWGAVLFTALCVAALSGAFIYSARAWR
jgi:hypothetical protein